MEFLHRSRQPIVGDTEQVVTVVGHQREGETRELVASYYTGQALEEIGTVRVVTEDGLTVAAAGEDVVNGSRDPFSPRPRHTATVPPSVAVVARCVNKFTLLARSRLDTKRCLTPP
jgi:hypothetical protein